MSHFRRLSAASAIALAAAGPAAADLTAAGVWEDFQAYAETYDLEMTTGAETPTPDGLRVEGISMTSTVADPAGTSTFTVEIPFVAFAEDDDGSVDVTVAEVSTLSVEFPGESGPVSMLFEIAQPGLTVDTREAADGLAYEFEAPEMVMLSVELSENGEPVPFDISVTIAEPRGSYLSAGEAPQRLDQDLDAASISFDVTGTDTESGGTFDMEAVFSEVTSTSTSSVPADTDMQNMSRAIRDGFSTDVSFAYASSRYSIDVTDETGPTAIEGGAAGGGGLTVTIGEGGLGYGTDAADSSFSFSGPGVPVPQVTAQIARSGFDVLMPATASETAAPFRFAMRVEELSISDDLWGMFDPAGGLDRSPWTMILDLTGMARLDVDIFDPEATAEMDPETVPGEIESVAIEELRLSVLGADLTGSGAATLDNSRMDPMTGMPAADGSLTLSLTGVNALFDQLVSLGLVPQDQLMMGRMMLGMFARPVGDDAFETVLEVRPDGSVFANGQQLQ